MEPDSLSLTVGSAALIAAVGGWIVAMLIYRARIEAAVASIEAAKQIELATLTERARGVDAQLPVLIERLRLAHADVEQWREQSEETGSKLSRLEERAARVGPLEDALKSAVHRQQVAEDALADLRATSSGELSGRSAELAGQTDLAARLLRERDHAHQERDVALSRVNELNAELADIRARTETEQESFIQQLRLLQDAKLTLSEQFKNLASEILEEKSRRFAEQNQASLGSLLEPLRLKLGEFQGKVEEVYVQESKDRSALQEQVRHLVSLNKALSDDAKNLTLALKGSSKTQGNWGELILERVLESSGLRKGIEYVAQGSLTREDGSRAMPDVVIHLPEERRLVIDAKVSLVAYERFTTAADDDSRSAAMRAHIDSVRAHIKSLSEKRYEVLYGIKSLDFVLAFVPIEPAFMMSVTNDGNLFQEAWDRNVLLVSPSTLLFVVRTVAHLWRQEAQTRNAQDIAKRGAELYDKLSGFVGDLQNVGLRLKQARDAYDLAEGKLVSGRGNVIRQAEMLRALGVKPTKALPAPLVSSATDFELDADVAVEPEPSA